MRRGWGKLEPNSYSDEYKRNWNSWGVIHLCIDKTIHYFLKLDRSISIMIYKSNWWNQKNAKKVFLFLSTPSFLLSYIYNLYISIYTWKLHQNKKCKTHFIYLCKLEFDFFHKLVKLEERVCLIFIFNQIRMRLVVNLLKDT